MTSREKPVRIRRNIQNYGDPYLRDLKPNEAAICRECRSVYAGYRWTVKGQATRDLAKAGRTVETLCPACRKIRDRMPGGILKLSGKFLKEHVQEIVDLLNRENREAIEVNPLGRIMDIDQSDMELTVLTTNEKLAQKLGRAVHRAFSGEIEYQWSEDTKLARVNWRRD